MQNLQKIQDTQIQIIEFNINLFQKYIEYADVKKTTLNGYIVCIRQFAKWMQAQGIRQPNRADIKAYKKHLDESKFTAGTKARYLRCVKHFFKWTASEGLYPNIADNIKGAKVKQDNTKKEAFAEQDIKNILQSIDTTTEAGKRDFAMILLSVTCGLRIIEMQRADIEDLQTIKGQRILYIQGKGHDSKDDYKKLVPEVAQAIDDYLQSRGNPKKNEPLFSGVGNRAKGGRLTEPSISRIIKNVFIKAGYDCGKLTAHSLRHTSNTLLFKSGADLYTVQQHARHSDPKTTEIYLHVLDKEKEHCEQDIFNQIFRPEQKDKTAQAVDALQGMTDENRAKAIEFILMLSSAGMQAATMKG